MLDPYRSGYSSRLKNSASAFGVRPDSVQFTLDGETVSVDVTFRITDELGSYPSAEDISEKYQEQLQELASVWGLRNGPVKVIAWSPELATARACDIPKPADD